MRAVGSTPLGKTADLGPLLLRVGVGLVFAAHGWQKFDNGVENFEPMLSGLDVPQPELVAWLMTVAEGVGGVLLIAGLFTRLVTLPLIAIIVGAIWLVKTDVGFIVADSPGAELETALLAGLLGLLFIGPGRLSLDGALRMETAVAPVSASAPRHSDVEAPADNRI
ncbi:MAG: DoxX family membrane protein [Propionibacteriales bacterium]|nr:DoxX family membrane protein [Propionibacteriales bacterium]